MFAYCGNNPINASDATGMLFLFDDAVLLAACFVVAVVAVVVVVYSPPVREAIYGMADALADVLLDVFESIEQAAENIIEEFKEHTKGARNSTRGKHEEGNARRNRDAQGEKGDARRRSGAPMNGDCIAALDPPPSRMQRGSQGGLSRNL